MIFQIEGISKLIKNGGGQKFRCADFRELKGPGVYVAVDKGRALYIGFGKSLLNRVSNPNHFKRYVIDDCEEILLYPCISIEAARELEALLIRALRPPLNSNLKSTRLDKPPFT